MSLTIPKSRETIIQEALCREEAVRLHRIAEAEIITPLEDLFIPPPTLAISEKESMWRKIKTIIAIKQYLP